MAEWSCMGQPDLTLKVNGIKRALSQIVEIDGCAGMPGVFVCRSEDERREWKKGTVRDLESSRTVPFRITRPAGGALRDAREHPG